MLKLERNINVAEYLSVQGMVFFLGLIVTALYANVVLGAEKPAAAVNGKVTCYSGGTVVYAKEVYDFQVASQGPGLASTSSVKVFETVADREANRFRLFTNFACVAEKY